jgi:hypothetical protein
MDACPAVFKRGGYNFRLPPLKVRDLRLDLGKRRIKMKRLLIISLAVVLVLGLAYSQFKRCRLLVL